MKTAKDNEVILVEGGETYNDVRSLSQSSSPCHPVISNASKAIDTNNSEEEVEKTVPEQASQQETNQSAAAVVFNNAVENAKSSTTNNVNITTTLSQSSFQFQSHRVREETSYEHEASTESNNNAAQVVKEEVGTDGPASAAQDDGTNISFRRGGLMPTPLQQPTVDQPEQTHPPHQALPQKNRRRLSNSIDKEEKGEERGPLDFDHSDRTHPFMSPPSDQQNQPSSLLEDWRSRTMKFFSQTNDLNNNSSSIFGQDDDDNNAAKSSAIAPPDSEVERIVQRLEDRNTNRVHVPVEVKSRFLRLCNEYTCRRRHGQQRTTAHRQSGNYGGGGGEDEEDGNSVGLDKSFVSNDTSGGANYNSNILLRSEIIQIRQSIRLEVEGRTKLRRATDGIKAYLGFRCHCKVLMNVLNRAVDLMDESCHRPQCRSSITNVASCSNGPKLTKKKKHTLGRKKRSLNITDDDDDDDDEEEMGIFDENAEDWFYYKDFAFYSLKIESNYPWMRNAGAFSILLTLAFYVFTPVLWCSILKDPNICSTGSRGAADGSEVGGGSGWLSALFFASATMSTVGYGDVTVFVNIADVDDDDSNHPETWRVFVATCFMILSLVVSVVGFQAGLDSQFYPFRRRLKVFGKRVYEILREANVIVKGNDVDPHEEIASRMRWSKFSQLAEISLVFLLLNLVGMFAVQLSLLGEKENEFGDLLEISWMESFYWAVQTTTTIGYGDINVPESLRWFLLLYLAISTYYVGSAFGKLGKLSKELESMQRLYLWQQQEASYTMLHDFSGRPDGRDGGGFDDDGDERAKKKLDFEPEIDQFEFTIASLVVLGKITSEDVRPILEKFKRLTGEHSNKITSSDVLGPLRKETNDTLERDDSAEQVNTEADTNHVSSIGPGRTSLTRKTSSLTFDVGKKIAKAFREEILSSSLNNDINDDIFEEVKETEKVVDYSNFRIPKNTHAIAIDDSKFQRKLLAKIFDNAGISADRRTIIGDGYSEVMGFEDYVVAFMKNHDGYVFMIVEENLDVVDESSNKHDTISGSQCVENIRKRLPPEAERRMFALIRSTNNSSSDIAIYKTRAHGFLPKLPIKRDKINEKLAPLWWGRFPPSEFGESMGINSQNDSKAMSSANDIACTPYDISQKVKDIEALFERNAHMNETHLIHDEMHELEDDLLTLNSNISVYSAVEQINLIQVTQSPASLVDGWRTLQGSIKEIIQSLQKTFRLPKNTYAIAIDDSKIQRKLLGKFFDFLNIPPENCTIVGDGYSEINGFVDMVVDFMQCHKNDYVLMIVNENLDVVDESDNKSKSISGSQCADNIRRRLPVELERRMLVLVRSANDCTADIAIYNERTHGFLPKAPIRREKVNDAIAPLWMKRFPPSDPEFRDSVGFENMSDEIVYKATSDEVAPSPYDIAQKLIDIESLFKKEAHFTDTRIIHDQLHELKGDLLTLNFDTSMVSILGMINLILLGHNQSPEAIVGKWHALRDRIYDAINSLQSNNRLSGGQALTLARNKCPDSLRSKQNLALSSSSNTHQTTSN